MFYISLNKKNILIKKEIIFISLIFFIGLLLRITFGFFRPTEDLFFYIDLDQIQLTRYGFEKQILFYPLKVFPSPSQRIVAIAFLNSLLFTICFRRLTLRSNQIINSYLALLVIVTSFFAQIDMHLVRQQICIYLFVLAITGNKFKYTSPLLILLSMVYHEGGIALFLSWIFALIIKEYRLNSIKNILFLISLLSNTFLFLYLGEIGTLFLIITSFANHFLKSESTKTSLYISFLFFQISIILLLLIGPYTFLSSFVNDVTIARLIGFGVSYGLLLLLGNGKFKGRKNFFGNLIILLLLILYSTINFL